MAQIDATDADAARVVLAAAREEPEALDHVDEELRRRDAEDHEQYAHDAARAALTRTYNWYITFLAAVESVLEARAALVDAEQAMTAVGRIGRLGARSTTPSPRATSIVNS